MKKENYKIKKTAEGLKIKPECKPEKYVRMDCFMLMLVLCIVAVVAFQISKEAGIEATHVARFLPIMPLVIQIIVSCLAIYIYFFMRMEE